MRPIEFREKNYRKRIAEQEKLKKWMECFGK
jgi:hypothetical protein